MTIIAHDKGAPQFHLSPICAVVVTWHPDEGFLRRLARMQSEVEVIVVVDNGSDERVVSPLRRINGRKDINLILNERNRGIAAALNQGFRWAMDHGYEYVLTMDQDSVPLSGMSQSLLSVYRRHPHRNRIAIVAPRIEDHSIPRGARFLRPRGRFLFERAPCAGEWLEGVSIVITSGALHSLTVYQEIGGFREDFFIDYVDTEYCLRTQAKGYKILVSCDSRLEHRLGRRERKKLGPFTFLPTFHPPFRWYYISRNRISMLRMYALKFPHWLNFEIISSLYIFFRMLLFEDLRLKKLTAFFYGTLDGLCGRMGKIPPEIARRLDGDI